MPRGVRRMRGGMRYVTSRDVRAFLARRGRQLKPPKRGRRYQRGGKAATKRKSLTKPPTTKDVVEGSTEKYPTLPPDIPKTRTIQTQELDLDWTPPYVSDIESYYVEEIQPIQGKNTDTSKYQFNIPSSIHWTDLTQLELYVKGKATDAAGADLADKTLTGEGKGGREGVLENNLFHSLWSGVDPTMDNVQIRWNMSHYNIWSQILALLTIDNTDSDEAWMKYRYEFDNTVRTPLATGDTGIDVRIKHAGKHKRMKLYNAASPSFQMSGTLNNPVLMASRYLPPNHEMQLQLKRVDNEVLTYGNAELKFKIEEIYILAKRYKVKPDYQARYLRMKEIHFPIVLPEEYPWVIPQGTQKYERQLMMQGDSPTTIFIVFMDNRAYVGNKDHSQFNFHHYNIDHICLYQNGLVFPRKDTWKELGFGQPKAEHGTAMGPYEALNKASRIFKTNKKSDYNCISYSNFIKGGNTIFVFDMTVDNKMAGLDPGQTAEANNAPVSIKIKFSAPLDHTVSMLAYPISHKSVKINTQTNKPSFNWL